MTDTGDEVPEEVYRRGGVLDRENAIFIPPSQQQENNNGRKTGPQTNCSASNDARDPNHEDKNPLDPYHGVDHNSPYTDDGNSDHETDNSPYSDNENSGTNNDTHPNVDPLCNSSPEDRQIAKLLQKIREHATPLDECEELYTRISKAVDNSEQEVTAFDPIIMSILKDQIRKNSTRTLKEMITAKIRLLQTGKELRVLVTGALGVGKSSVLNLIMGDEYLPAYNGNTTAIPCEIVNSYDRFAYLFSSHFPTPIMLPLGDKDSSQWEELRGAIEEKIYDNKQIDKVEIHWPLKLLQDSQRTAVKGHEEDPEDMIHVRFLDLPGVCLDSNDGIDLVLENIPDYQMFIVVLNVFGGDGVLKSIQTLMSNINSHVEVYGEDFDPQSVLFLLNKMDQVKESRNKKPVKTQVLQKINTVWQSVGEDQLYQMSCKKIIEEQNIEEFQKRLCEFLAEASYYKIEGHCRWLIDFLETACAMLIQGKEWQPREERLGRLSRQADEDIDFLRGNKASIDTLEEELNEKADIATTKLKEKLSTRLGSMFAKNKMNEEEQRRFNRKLQDLIRDENNNGIIKEFQENTNASRKKYRNSVRANIKLKEFFDMDFCEQEEHELNWLFYGIGTVLTVPFAALIMLAMALYDEYRSEFQHNRQDKRINKEVNCLRKMVKEMIKSENSFIDGLVRKLELNQNAKVPNDQNRGEDPYVRTISAMLDEVWTIYIRDVVKHEYRMSELQPHIKSLGKGGNAEVWLITLKCNGRPDAFAKKVIRRPLRKIHRRSEQANLRSSRSSLPDNLNIYKECMIMRQLSKEGNEHFVAYKGTAYKVDMKKKVYELAVLMELCHSTVSDEIKILSEEMKLAEWLADGRRKMFHYAIGAAKGLLFVHQHGLLHRDVKSSNFLIKIGDTWRDDVVKICDVGHSKEYDRVSTIGKQRGTRIYQAPEVFYDNRVHTMKSDVYSFGILLWELWYAKRIPVEYLGKVLPLVPKPDNDMFYNLLKQCLLGGDKWRDRPNMAEVVQILQMCCQ